LLTRENIKQYFNNIRNKFKKKDPVDISKERKLYKKVVLYFIKKGYSFKVADTPRQFSSKVQEGVLDEATDMYEAYRYGKKVISTSQLNRIEKKINDK
jgi:SOS response regulatory protein OraA/RecX